MGEVGENRSGAKSYDREQAWSSMTHSIICGRKENIGRNVDSRTGLHRLAEVMDPVSK